MHESDDWELVARARGGDRAAFAELVRRYESPVMHFCLRMVLSREDAEDLAQDAFVRLHRHLPRLEPRAKFSTLLFGIARNLALNHLRDRQRRGGAGHRPLEAAVLRAPPDDRPDRGAHLREIEELITEGLNRLRPEHREILILRERMGMDYGAIADILNCQLGTVKSRLARAREQLRIEIAALGGESP